MISNKVKYFGSSFILAGLVFLTPLSVRADCVNPAGVEAQITYSSAQNVLMYCNGTAWIAMEKLNPAADARFIDIPVEIVSDIPPPNPMEAAP